MVLQDKITVFLNKAQNKVASLMLATSVDLFESYNSEENSKLAIELIDVITCLQDELLDWTDYEIESTIDYYNSKAQLTDIAIVNFEDNSTYVVGNSNSVGDSSWIAPFTALSLRVDSNNSNLLSEIDRLDQEINNLDFSNLIPQEVLDEIDANTLSRHTHSNKTVLDSVNQGHLDSITLNNAHRANSSIHVTSNQKTSWDSKVSQTQLTDGLTSKANTSHIHDIADVIGLGEALVDIVPEKGDKGDDGITPTILGGTITEGEYSVNINNDNPQYPVLSLVIPAPKDGEDFHIDVFGLSQNRLSSLYNNSAAGYSFLGTDNGMLYFRKPYDSEGNFISAVTTSGWSGVQFGGFNGWSPSFKLVIRDSGEIVLAISGWFGGSGPVPTLGLDYAMYLGADGYTPYIEQAINIRGLQGEDGEPGTAGKIMFPDISDVIANRYLYDDSPVDTIFLDNVAGVIYRKKSETIGDWSDGFQWKGDKGDKGEQGDIGTVIPSFTDDQFEVIDNLDSTKKLKFEVSGVTGNITRTLTIPNKNGTIALLDDVSEGGHVIADSDEQFPAQPVLKFTGNVTVTDIQGETVVDITNTIDASGFNGNLTPEDDTPQKVAQKFDDYVDGTTTTDYENIFFEVVSPDKAYITRGFNWKIASSTEYGGTSTILTSGGADYTTGATVTAGDYLTVTNTTINARLVAIIQPA